MRCSIDDSALCCGKCGTKKVVAVVPVLGRRPLVKLTIQRLLHKNRVDKVICVGDISRDKKVCEAAGAEWITHPNDPLAAKWNEGFIAAKKHNPDAVLFVGSSDWLSDNWLPTLTPYIEYYDMVGLPGCYLLDINTNTRTYRACYWPGYVGRREGESIGIGRLISARILNKLNWKPFDDKLNHSLDYSMRDRILSAGGKERLLSTSDIKSMAISCNEWPNKHQFEAHWNNRLPSQRIDPKKDLFKWFPESLQIFKTTTI